VLLSRSCALEPVMVTTAGTGPVAFLGRVSVPASVWPAAVSIHTSRAVYGASAGAE
jgi:hypothetical protein